MRMFYRRVILCSEASRTRPEFICLSCAGSHGVSKGPEAFHRALFSLEKGTIITTLS